VSRQRDEAFVARAMRAIAAAFQRAAGLVVRDADMQALLLAIEARDVDRVMLVLDTAPYATVGEAVREALIASGRDTADRLPRLRGPNGVMVQPRFQPTAPGVAAWVLSESTALRDALTRTEFEAVRAALQAGVARGDNPRDIARSIVGTFDPQAQRRMGGVIGLHSTFASYVDNARDQLLSGDPAQLAAYLQRQRRDARFDRLVFAAMDGGSLTRAQIETMVARYSDRLLSLRGETIARTEAVRALQEGRRQSLGQVVDAGLLPAESIVRRWDATGDSRTRDDHADMDGQQVAIDEPFTFPDGSQAMYPTDDSLGAPGEQVINCRCYVATEVDLRRAAA
jgi:hypothetical protein